MIWCQYHDECSFPFRYILSSVLLTGGNKKTVALLSKMTKACDYDGFVLQSKRASRNGCAISSFESIFQPSLVD